MKPPIYLDYQATTPLAPEAAEAMRLWLAEKFANPHSSHRLGREAAAAVEVARERVSSALSHPPTSFRHPGEGRDPRTPGLEILDSGLGRDDEGGSSGTLSFTSGATEALNWALKGAAFRLPPNRRRIVTLATEHAAVLDTVDWLARQGFEADILPVGADGLVDLNLLATRITDRTGLVAVMLVNNEIGVIQPVEEIGRLARQRGALFLCDAVQGFGRMPVPLHACDMVAVSAHKVHGPKGIGALWVREGVQIEPLIHGGGQEGGGRSGTLSPALCVGFGEAARLILERQDQDADHVARLWSIARDSLPGWTLNGSADHRYHGNLNIRRPGVDSARLISDVRHVAFSAGSACASGSGRPSHVLKAIGLTDVEARASIRLGFGRYSTQEELVEALTLINDAAERQLSFAA